MAEKLAQHATGCLAGGSSWIAQHGRWPSPGALLPSIYPSPHPTPPHPCLLACLPACSFYFWVDVIATLSILIDIPTIMDPVIYSVSGGGRGGGVGLG